MIEDQLTCFEAVGLTIALLGNLVLVMIGCVSDGSL